MFETIEGREIAQDCYVHVRRKHSAIVRKMAKHKEPVNPFYILLVLTGLVFCVTASAYGVMAVRGLYPEENEISESGRRMLVWLDENGFWLLMIEIVALGIFTFGAIALDEFRSRKTGDKLESHINGEKP